MAAVTQTPTDIYDCIDGVADVLGRERQTFSLTDTKEKKTFFVRLLLYFSELQTVRKQVCV